MRSIKSGCPGVYSTHASIGLPMSSRPVFRQDFGQPHKLSETFHLYPVRPVLPLSGIYCWVRIHHETGSGLHGVWEQGKLAWRWPLLRFLRPRHTVRPEHKIQRFKYDMGRIISPGCSPKAPTFGSAHSVPCRFGLLTGALWILPVCRSSARKQRSTSSKIVQRTLSQFLLH